MTRRSMSPLAEIRQRQMAIGVKLRFLFEPTVRAPIPKEWLDLLRKADERGTP